MYQILPYLTKDYLLEYLTEEMIYCHYFGTTKIIENYKYNSPFDICEEEPSFVFKYTNGKLRATDYGGDFYGDCFDFVGRLHGLKTNKKEEFIKIFHIIAKDFKLHQYGEGQPIINKELYDAVKVSKRSTKLQIDFEPRPFNSLDDTWIKLRIPLARLQKFKVIAINRLYLNENSSPIYVYRPEDPAYAYILDEQSKEYKIYFPKRKKRDKRRPRFISNTRKIQGINLIEKSNIGLITKSYKDVITLNNYCIDNKGIQSVAPSAESVLITPQEFEYISQFYDKIYSLMDYDPAGLHMAWLLRKHYNVKPLFFKNPTWNKKIKYPIKDFSDFVYHNDDTTVNNLIHTTFNNL